MSHKIEAQIPKEAPQKKDKTPFKNWAILLFLINFATTFSFISYIEDWAGWAWYSAFFQSMGLIGSAIVFSFAPPSILYQSNFLFNSGKPRSDIILLFVMIFSVATHYFICKSSFTKIKITEETLINDQNERYLDEKEKFEDLLAQNKFRLPTQNNQRFTDSRLITECFFKEINNFYSPLLKNKAIADSIYSRINTLLGMNYYFIPDKKEIEQFKKTFRVDYIFYNSDYSTLIAVTTFGVNRSNTEKYNHTIFLAHKGNEKLFAIAFDEGNYRFYKREYAAMNAIKSLFYNPDDETNKNWNTNARFGTTLLDLKYNEVLPNDLFWKSRMVQNFANSRGNFHTIDIEEDYYTKKKKSIDYQITVYWSN
jgi:hypothetical protein